MSTEGVPHPPVWWVLDGREPRPATMEEAAASWGTPEGFEENRRVAKTEVYDLVVSTVFLGIDHAFGGGPPVPFETMVYRPGPDDTNEWFHEWTQRYRTYDEAEAGHEETVGLLRLERGLVEVPTAFEEPTEEHGGGRG